MSTTLVTEGHDLLIRGQVMRVSTGTVFKCQACGMITDQPVVFIQFSKSVIVEHWLLYISCGQYSCMSGLRHESD
jgi:hypothetical protein